MLVQEVLPDLGLARVDADVAGRQVRSAVREEVGHVVTAVQVAAVGEGAAGGVQRCVVVGVATRAQRGESGFRLGRAHPVVAPLGAGGRERDQPDGHLALVVVGVDQLRDGLDRALQAGFAVDAVAGAHRAGDVQRDQQVVLHQAQVGAAGGAEGGGRVVAHGHVERGRTCRLAVAHLHAQRERERVLGVAHRVVERAVQFDRVAALGVDGGAQDHLPTGRSDQWVIRRAVTAPHQRLAAAGVQAGGRFEGEVQGGAVHIAELQRAAGLGGVRPGAGIGQSAGQTGLAQRDAGAEQGRCIVHALDRQGQVRYRRERTVADDAGHLGHRAGVVPGGCEGVAAIGLDDQRADAGQRRGGAGRVVDIAPGVAGHGQRITVRIAVVGEHIAAERLVLADGAGIVLRGWRVGGVGDRGRHGVGRRVAADGLETAAGDGPERDGEVLRTLRRGVGPRGDVEPGAGLAGRDRHRGDPGVVGAVGGGAGVVELDHHVGGRGLRQRDGVAGGDLALQHLAGAGERDLCRVLGAGCGAAGADVVDQAGGDRGGQRIGQHGLEAAAADPAQRHDDAFRAFGEGVVQRGQIEAGRGLSGGHRDRQHLRVVGAPAGGAGIAQRDLHVGPGRLRQRDGVAAGRLAFEHGVRAGQRHQHGVMGIGRLATAGCLRTAVIDQCGGHRRLCRVAGDDLEAAARDLAQRHGDGFGAFGQRVVDGGEVERGR